MSLRGAWCAALVLAVGSPANQVGAAGEADPAAAGRLVEEVWERAEVGGTRVGFLHTTVREREEGGLKRLRATADLNLTFRRHNTLLRLRMEHGTEETPGGKVLGVFMRQHHDRGRQLVLAGTVEDDRLHVRIDGGRVERHIRWSSEVVGLYGLEHLFQKRRPKPGDRFRFLRYEPTLNTVIRVQVAVTAAKDVAGSRSVLRVDMTPDRIEVPGHRIQLPLVVWWLDESFVPVRRQMELEGLGTMTLTRTTRAQAVAPAAPAALADMGLKTLVPLDRAIVRPHATRSAVYRITLRGDSDPGTALARDGHQEVRALRGDTFELHVHPVRPGVGPAEEGPAGKEFLESCHYIDSDNPRVKELARRASGRETDPWAKARRLERWVRWNMRVDNGAPLVPAGQVAHELRGDCRSYALLLTALCRAEGIPARTAVGLIYVEKGRRPQLGFHMWTEVRIDGRWLGLDATLGQGRIGAAHLKIADDSWHGTQSLTPLLPVRRVLGKISVGVVRTE